MKNLHVFEVRIIYALKGCFENVEEKTVTASDDVKARAKAVSLLMAEEKAATVKYCEIKHVLEIDS